MAVAFALALGITTARADTEAEYAVKAAYLFKFTPFIQWPASAFSAPASPFYVCVFGDDPFGAALDQALDGHRVGDHPVRIRRLQTNGSSSDCHILYFGPSRAQLAAAALSRVRGTPVLTVTEQGQAPAGGVVQFMVRDGHVRFSIDAEAANANRVSISAKLLSLAASFRTGS